jgi:hypothetical protein
MVKTNIQTFTGEVEILSNLHVGPSGSSYLTANGAASNVLDITGNVGATFFVGDGGFLSNIATTISDIVNQGNVVSNVVTFEGNTNYAGVGLVTSSNVGIQNTAPSHTLSIGDKIRVDDNTVETSGQSVIQVDGRILATRFEGDGGLLSNIATTLESIVNQGNVSANVVKFSSNASVSEFAGAGLVTDSNVGIQNTAPTHNLSVGSNLHVNDTGSNVLTVHGNVVASNLNLGVFSITPAYGLNDVCNTSNGTSNVVQFQNATTSLVATSNITVGGNVTAQQLISTSNTEVGDRLKFSGSNVFVDTLRVADVAANIVTYDRTTGELLDSSGTFMNKFAVVSEQPPSDLFANATTVANHGGYTLTTSNLATNSNTFNAFDGTANAWVSGDLAGGYIGGANVFHENNLTQLSNLHPTQRGDWLAIEFPYKTTLRHMKLTPLTAAQFPASANIYATNNDLTWTEVNYWKDVNPVTASNVQTITVNATEQFKKYALVATKAAGDSSNVALQDWQLFTESFSIDGGKVAMAQQAATGGETVMDQHGPHGRLPKAVPLKKYPEIAFDASKVDGNDSTNTYVQAGYTVSSSRQETSSGAANFRPYTAFDGLDKLAAKNEFWLTGNFYTGTGTTGTNGDADQNATLFNSRRGEWIQLETPNKIKVNKFIIKSRTYDSISPRDHPKSGYLYASNNGTDWQEIKSFTNLVYAGVSPATSGSVNQSHGMVSVDVNSTDYYRYFRLQVTQRVANTFWSGSADTAITFLSLGELEYYGYEEDPPLGDTSVDTTFTSIMNTPQTTGTQVYVDGSLGETFTNRVVGPTVSNTHTTYVSTEKYWELSGNVESNVTLEANTFLSGDAPHSLSMWFNSSNLEANVSNSCIFSLATEEKLDSVNLDLQSNTWHNLTYAYQGEGGSRVTYLDGRKVAEDQAEDTFGDYPPFAMTGYSQGGYVVSTSNELSASYPAWKAFDDSLATSYDTWLSGSHYSGGTPSTHDGSETTTYNGTSTVNGEWIQLELPQKIKLSYYSLKPQIEGANDIYNERMPGTGKILGSNDGTNWYLIHDHSLALSDYTRGSYTNVAINTSTNTKAYKYIRFVIETTAGTENIAGIGDMKLYGHRENDLVRLPDPTNVLKYPHIAMTGPAQRGYVVSASSVYDGDTTYPYLPWNVFDGKITEVSGYHGPWLSASGTYDGSGAPSASPAVQTIESSNTWTGEWLQLELPHKIQLSKVEVLRELHSFGEDRSPRSGAILGSNNGTAWSFIHSWANIAEGDFLNTTFKDLGTITTTGYYKYIRFVTTATQSTTQTVKCVAMTEIKYYGTGVDSVPIQIGGGNIDKVANFRVYDKFVGEDQALEIWDAQKDTFRGVKNSVTLHKGRLGIGTTEPEGRLAVLDEPHNLEEFPPRAMTADKTYIEGHGEFCASVTEIYPNAYAYKAFNKIQSGSGLDFHWSTNTADYDNVTGVYTGSSDYFTNVEGQIALGHWIQIDFPYKINYRYSEIQGPDHTAGRQPHTGYIVGSNDLSGVWTSLHNYSGMTRTGVRDFVTYTPPTISTQSFKYFRLVIEKMGGSTTAGVSQWHIFGTREQGQSVLHDGQLTLTKNLTVPRIGPALDADDTPRRDRLVVEYNTSTNPTFEGAVRDTSGRGNDGAFYGGASYDATEKAWTNTTQYGTGDYVYTKTHLTSGDFPFAMSFWVKMTQAYNGIMTMVMLGSNATNKGMAIDIYNAGNIYWYGYDGSALLWNTAGTNQTSDIFPIGKWVHVVAVHHQGSGAATDDVYINGEIMPGTPTVTNPTGTNVINFNDNPDLVIGARGVNASSASNDFCPASYSNFKLYDTALTAEEVKTLYDMGRTGSVANPQPLHIAAPLYSPGTIVQVDQVFTNNLGISTTSTSPIDITGLSITIQPKFANSKILVSYQLAIGSNYHAFVHIKRTQNGVTSYDVGRGAGSGFRQRASSYVSHLNSSHVCSENMEFLDSANGIDPITYQIQMWVASSSYIFILNRSISYGNSEYFATLGSSLTVKEICQ